ncbi:MAG: class I SAM-dependent methyltransferase [Candidatus Binatia bacterium]
MSEHDRNHWEEAYACHSGILAGPAPFLADHFHLLQPGRTLDLAAGSGRNASFLAERGHRVLAADVARVALRQLRRRSRAVDVVQVDLERPCFRIASFDNIVCINFLDRALFPAMLRWLRPGGALLVDTFLVDQREVGHPRNPAFLLGHNELLERLREARVLRYREGAVVDESGTSYRAGIVVMRAPVQKLTSHGAPA